MLTRSESRPVRSAQLATLLVLVSAGTAQRTGLADETAAAQAVRTYTVELKPIVPIRSVLADWPEFFAPVRYDAHFEAPRLVDQEGGDLEVRAWHFSFNARGLIEIPNRLRADRTAVIVVHPWGINDGQGWELPQPAGFAFGTPESIRFTGDHLHRVVAPFLKALRGKVKLIACSLPGEEDPLRAKAYRSMHSRPGADEQQAGLAELSAHLKSYSYNASSVPKQLVLPADRTLVGYFQKFPTIDFQERYNGPGYWKLPIPVHREIGRDVDDVVIYDAEGYPALRDFLEAEGVENVLLCGYHADLCVRSTTAGHDKLSRDFNVFLVGDCMLATSVANETPAHATNAAVCYDARQRMVTQASWVKYIPQSKRTTQ